MITGLVDVEPILDVLPVPLVLVEPGSGTAAVRQRGRAPARGRPDARLPARSTRTRTGSTTPPGARSGRTRCPPVRAARGERVEHVQRSTGRRRTACAPCSCPASTIALEGGRRVTVVTFEDVTALEGARRRSSGTGRRAAGAARQRRRCDHRPVARPQTRLCQPGRGPVVRDSTRLGRSTGSPTVEYLQGFDTTDGFRAPAGPRAAPGPAGAGRALSGAGDHPAHARSLDRRGELGAGQVPSAVRDPDCGVRLAINVIEDITELKRSEEAQRFLADASRRLSGSSLDYERTLTAVAELAVPAIADRCSVPSLADDELRAGGLEVMRTGAAWFETKRMVVPMTAGRVIGRSRCRSTGAPSIPRTCSWPRTSACGRAPRRERAALSRRVADRAHAADDTAAAGAARVPGAALAAAFHPAGHGLEVGGDFYDVFATGRGQWYLVIGDAPARAPRPPRSPRWRATRCARRRRGSARRRRSWAGSGQAMLDQDATGGRFCTIACAHIDLARSPGARHRVLRRAPAAGAAAGGRDGRAARDGRGRCSGSCPTPSCRTAARSCAWATRSCSTRTGLTEARAPVSMWSFEELAAAVRAAPMNGPGGAGQQPRHGRARRPHDPP